jgi:hypothetical protein
MAKAVEHLRSKCDEETLQYLRDLHARDPEWGDETTPEQHAEWEKKHGFSIPSPFHFGTGMQIRNCLREVIRDEELPAVDYDGHDFRNWDDWYHSVLERMLGVG